MEANLGKFLSDNKKPLIALAIAVLVIVMMVTAYQQKWGPFADNKVKKDDQDKGDDKKQEKEGFYDPDVVQTAQEFLDEGDMKGLMFRESQGYMGSEVESEVMPRRDELGYDGDWATHIAHEGAEPGVHLSHQQYIRELGPQTRGVSNQSIMDHVNDSNFRGMWRPPQPHRVKMHEGVREVPSDYVHQHPQVGIVRHNCDTDGYYGRVSQ